MLQLNHLRILNSVAAFGNLTEAAKINDCKQENVTYHLRKFERIIGCKLFTRATNISKSQLNLVGKRLVELSQEISRFNIKHDVELKDLATLIAVAKSSTMTIASEELKVHLSTVSVRIKKLEACYGVLFKRSMDGERLMLTPAGKELVKLALEVCSLVTEAEIDIQILKNNLLKNIIS